MASCEVHITSQNSLVLSNIESFMNDSSYRDILENSANYNTRLCIERRLRMPFLDAQTGVAQNHSNLFMSSRQRMPGLQNGQVYTYPSKRWRKRRRQYLMNFVQTKRKENDAESGDNQNLCMSENSAISTNEDSKDSIGGNSAKDEPTSKVPDAWYYEELEMQEMEGYDEPDPDSDYDYEDSYTKKRKKRSGKPSRNSSDSPMKRGIKGFGRGRRKGINYTPDYSDTDKPYYCDLCGARYKTRPGLTYHYTHSHKEKTSSQDDDTSLDGPPSSPSVFKDKVPPQPSTLPPHLQHCDPLVSTPPSMPSGPSIGTNTTTTTNNNGICSVSALQSATAIDLPGQQPWGKFQDSYLSFLNSSSAGGAMNPNTKKNTRLQSQMGVTSAGTSTVGSLTGTSTGLPPVVPDEELHVTEPEAERKEEPSKESSPPSQIKLKDNKDKAKPSPYCDFCLGNEEANKKSGQPEVLVSCSDCGRSGHPTCLQFTTNMIVSVRKYRWQCIECKCCSICGTSDNDDQLLFCDDCDRGYHMYCLSPALTQPPEGSWSCQLCIVEFHS